MGSLTAAEVSGRRLQQLLDAVVAVSADLALSDVLAHLVRAACEVVGARYGALGVIGPDGRHLKEFVTYGLTPQERAAIGPLPTGHGILGLLITDPRPLRLADIRDHPSSTGLPANHPPIHTFVGAPIRVREAVFGNLYLAGKQGGDLFTREDEAVLVALAAAAGVAIDNARLYEQSLQDTAVSGAASELTRTLLEHDDQSGLQLVAAQAYRLSGAAGALVAWPADHGGGLAVRAVVGCEEPDVLVGSGLGDLTPVDGLLFFGDDIDQPGQDLGERLGALLGRRRPGVALSLGLGRAGGGPAGLLAVAWPKGEAAARQEAVAMLQEFTRQAGLALLAAAARRDAARMATLEDRERIARDMHDHVIQRLFATGLSLQTAARMTSSERVRTRLEDAVDELDSAIKDIRTSIYELRRPAPDGFAAELRELVAGFEHTLGFPPQLELQGDTSRMRPALSTDVLAVVREALANVARHAHASWATVRVSVSEDASSVEVRDDGVGMAPNAARSGLLNLASRATARGGSFDVRAIEPAGTVLHWQTGSLHARTEST